MLVSAEWQKVNILLVYVKLVFPSKCFLFSFFYRKNVQLRLQISFLGYSIVKMLKYYRKLKHTRDTYTGEWENMQSANQM